MRRELTVNVIAIVKDYVRILRSDVFAHARFLVVQNSKFKQVQLQVSDMPIAHRTGHTRMLSAQSQARKISTRIH